MLASDQWWASSCPLPRLPLTKVHAHLTGRRLELVQLQQAAVLPQGRAQFWRVGWQLLWLHWGGGFLPVRPPSSPRSLCLAFLQLQLCLSVCVSIPISGSPFLCLPISLSLSLSLPKFSPDGTQKVTRGSWTPSLAAQALVSPRPHPRRICRCLCGRFSAGRIDLWAGCRRTYTSGLREGAHASVWLGPAFLGAGCLPGSASRAFRPPQATPHRPLPTWPYPATPQ